ncbi:hypothetical protein ECG_01864 [Echinococcus granulosus]|uniref:Ovule protein n=1 Tax=Echinococcus granulosus TaxID=6210 RepID=A0A068W9X1_ECHGR|nr:hypothetical protein ECG_01864 [Echinococcus granulosus]CDS15180.1 hypothetical protein EgrG_002014300 [Echinococcus granulosus]
MPSESTGTTLHSPPFTLSPLHIPMHRQSSLPPGVHGYPDSAALVKSTANLGETLHSTYSLHISPHNPCTVSSVVKLVLLFTPL